MDLTYWFLYYSLHLRLWYKARQNIIFPSSCNVLWNSWSLAGEVAPTFLGSEWAFLKKWDTWGIENI